MIDVKRDNLQFFSRFFLSLSLSHLISAFSCINPFQKNRRRRQRQNHVETETKLLEILAFSRV